MYLFFFFRSRKLRNATKLMLCAFFSKHRSTMHRIDLVPAHQRDTFGSSAIKAMRSRGTTFRNQIPVARRPFWFSATDASVNSSAGDDGLCAWLLGLAVRKLAASWNWLIYWRAAKAGHFPANGRKNGSNYGDCFWWLMRLYVVCFDGFRCAVNISIDWLNTIFCENSKYWLWKTFQFKTFVLLKMKKSFWVCL